MSRLEFKAQQQLLKEAKKYLEDVKPASDIALERKKGGVILTESHIYEWLEVFYDDRIMLDGCNHSKVKY